MITTDKNLRYQQDLAGRRLAVLFLPTTSWPKLEPLAPRIAAAIGDLKPGEVRDLLYP